MAIDPTIEPIDRLSPIIRPPHVPVMYQEWRHLTFLHWEVAPDCLRLLLPPDLELDTFDGRAYVGLVSFTMRGVRPKFLPSLPWLSFFHETNVRTYVHRGGKDPGVWFFSLEAANPVAVAIARATFGLPYYHARMCLMSENGEAFPRLNYVSERCGEWSPPARSEVRAHVVGPVTPALPGTLEHFLAERYVLYSQRGGKLFRGQVHHQPYPLQLANVDTFDENLVTRLGIACPPAAPLAHYASGVKVEVFRLTPL